MGGNSIATALFARRSSGYRPESALKQVGYLLVLALVGVGIMFVGLGVLDLILTSIQS